MTSVYITQSSITPVNVMRPSDYRSSYATIASSLIKGFLAKMFHARLSHLGVWDPNLC